MDERKLKDVELHITRTEYLNKSMFLLALIDNISSRMEGTIASGARRESDKAELQEFLYQIECLDKRKWPAAIDSPWLEGEKHLNQLCLRF